MITGVNITLYLEYKQSSKLKKIGKWAKDINMHFLKEHTQMANKHIKMFQHQLSLEKWKLKLRELSLYIYQNGKKIRYNTKCW